MEWISKIHFMCLAKRFSKQDFFLTFYFYFSSFETVVSATVKVVVTVVEYNEGETDIITYFTQP